MTGNWINMDSLSQVPFHVNCNLSEFLNKVKRFCCPCFIPHFNTAPLSSHLFAITVRLYNCFDLFVVPHIPPRMRFSSKTIWTHIEGQRRSRWQIALTIRQVFQFILSYLLSYWSIIVLYHFFSSLFIDLWCFFVVFYFLFCIFYLFIFELIITLNKFERFWFVWIVCGRGEVGSLLFNSRNSWLVTADHVHNNNFVQD